MDRGPNDHIGPGAVLIDQLREGGDGETENQTLRPTLDIEGVARTCHEVNRVYCVANGDFSQSPWDEAADWQRDSALKGVTAALDGVTDEELHALWCDTKHQDGWVYGEVKDAVLKTHPCLVPYAELPEFQKVKDTLFRTVVESLKPYLP